MGTFQFIAVNVLRTIEYLYIRSIDINARRAIAYGDDLFSIDMNALRAITYGCGLFSIDIYALRAITYGGGLFSIDMNALRAMRRFPIGKQYQ